MNKSCKGTLRDAHTDHPYSRNNSNTLKDKHADRWDKESTSSCQYANLDLDIVHRATEPDLWACN